MDIESIKSQWIGHFEDVIDSPKPVEWNRLTDAQRTAMRTKRCVFFPCPCGEGGHWASRFYYEPEEGELSVHLSPVLTCFRTEKQWFVRSPDVAEIIRQEELNFFQRLEKHVSIVNKVVSKRGWSEDTKEFLRDTHGVLPEESEAIMSQSAGV